MAEPRVKKELIRSPAEEIDAMATLTCLSGASVMKEAIQASVPISFQLMWESQGRLLSGRVCLRPLRQPGVEARHERDRSAALVYFARG